MFVASGAAGLIYQVVWSRELVLVFGNTTFAISTIVSAVMFGLGFGGFVGGKLAARSQNLLRLYGMAEVLVAVLAFLLTSEFALIGTIYRGAYQALSPWQLTMVRLFLAFTAVSPATFLMGLTLPLLTQARVRSLHSAGSEIGELYAANTLGAVLGTVVSGFVLIELLGLTHTVFVAVGLNLGAGLLALLLAARAPGPAADAADPQASAPRESPRRLIYAVTFVSGFVSLALEILWTRQLAEGTGSRIYIFVVILALFLLGIALGSFVYRRVSSPGRDNLTVLGLCLGAVAVPSVLTVLIGNGLVIRHPFEVDVFLILPATMMMGYAFPLTVRLATRNASEAGERIGNVYGWNTAGGITGALLAAFVLAGVIGTNNSILILAGVSLGLGAWLVLLDKGTAAGHRPRLGAAMAGLSLLLAASPLLHTPLTATATENALVHDGTFVRHLEDYLATVDVSGGSLAQRQIYVTGVGMTGLTVDTKLMAYLPKVLRPRSSTLLDIAFGMGSTYKSGLLLGLKTDAVELSPSVPSQMGAFQANADKYQHSPLGRIIEADGRNYVSLTNARYDLIVVDPPPPIQSAGTVVLYTREFILQSRARLNPGGVFLLWIPYEEWMFDFKAHARTLRSAFAHSMLVFGPGHNGVFMFGSDSPMAFSDDAVRQYLGSAAAAADFAGAADDPKLDGDGWARLVREETWRVDSQIDSFVGPGPLITDDRPLTEYYLLRTTFSDVTMINEQVLRHGP